MDSNENIVFDYIISLGGNCAAASQLKQRNLRSAAMPFDYFFLRDIDDLKSFINALKNDFAGCFEKDKMIELTGEKRGTSDLYQYQDTVSGFNIIHLFHRPIHEKGVYEESKKIINRRLERFFNICKNNSELCFIMSINFEVDNELIFSLRDILIEKFGNKINLIFMIFSAKSNEKQNFDNLAILRYCRPNNIYDYSKTNFEWEFLDAFILRKTKSNKHCFKINKLKRGFQIVLFDFISTILRLNLYIFGLRLDICIGKIRN